jgi:hypothetical protein
VGVWVTVSFSAAGAWVLVLTILRRYRSLRGRDVLDVPTDARLS